MWLPLCYYNAEETHRTFFLKGQPWLIRACMLWFFFLNVLPYWKLILIGRFIEPELEFWFMISQTGKHHVRSLVSPESWLCFFSWNLVEVSFHVHHDQVQAKERQNTVVGRLLILLTFSWKASLWHNPVSLVMCGGHILKWGFDIWLLINRNT